MKNASVTEAETVNAGTEFIVRHIAQQQVGEHTQKRLVSSRQKQGRAAHPERKGVGILPCEEFTTEVVKTII